MRIPLVVALIFPVGAAQGSAVYEAKVVAITDGDTIQALRSDNTLVRVRLAGIDCPERRQPWGNRAKQAARESLAGKVVSLEVTGTDRYGRTVANVYVDGVNVNRQLVQHGHCWAYTRYVTDVTLFTLQDDAKAAQRGLWGLSKGDRVPPWEWRRQK